MCNGPNTLALDQLMPTSRKHALSDWGSDIDARLRAAHVTKAALAQQLRLHPSTLFRWLQREPPSRGERRRVENVLEQLDGTRPSTLADRLTGSDSDKTANQLRSLITDLRAFRRRVAQNLSDGADVIPIHDVVYWVNRVLGVTETTIAVRDGLAAMIGVLPLALYHISPDLQARWVSAGAETLFGWSSKEVTIRGPMSFIHPDDIGMASEAVAQLNETGTYDPIDVRVRCKDGSYKACTARAVAVYGEDGQVTGFMTSLMPSPYPTQV
jgi:PAS domain S-box-containing protein